MPRSFRRRSFARRRKPTFSWSESTLQSHAFNLTTAAPSVTWEVIDGATELEHLDGDILASACRFWFTAVTSNVTDRSAVELAFGLLWSPEQLAPASLPTALTPDVNWWVRGSIIVVGNGGNGTQQVLAGAAGTRRRVHQPRQQHLIAAVNAAVPIGGTAWAAGNIPGGLSVRVGYHIPR